MLVFKYLRGNKILFFGCLFSLLLHDKADCIYGRNRVEKMMVHIYFSKLLVRMTELFSHLGLLREEIPL